MTAHGWKGIPRYALNEVGVTVEPDGLVRIPYRLADGGLYAERVVAPTGKRWWRPGDGRPVIPFGLERQAPAHLREYHTLAVCEGESDALAVYAAFAHLGVDVLGLPGSGTWRTEWREHLIDPAGAYAAVYVIGDGDDAGRRMTTAVVADVPEAMPVWLGDGDDARSIIQTQGADAMLELLALAESYRHDAGIGKGAALAA